LEYKLLGVCIPIRVGKNGIGIDKFGIGIELELINLRWN